jgi:hypothetical protein
MFAIGTDHSSITGYCSPGLGSSRSDIERKLREIAGQEAKMRNKIPGILRSLDNYGWFDTAKSVGASR